ncbi:ovarian-specific serine/threonine-protein kinase Lok-like [Drosophila kikkawai]|uniref:Ovarian-specific serine/threonine-protein kinase Lok-like n=1 Tax=Drosophila kikkawai TaxID=30033 RepID=A0A6P4IDF2_DROKI|nr:ovarian-specific serine/threonine-protein kinase Lok-like [Drosophila kikkawai]
METKNQACRQKIAWARLCCKNITSFEALDLINEEFSVGRAWESSLVLTLRELPERILKVISKVHFIIKRANSDPSCPIYIQDVSQNGTFVNNEKIGRNKEHVLKDGDAISFSQNTDNLLVFVDLRLPVELTKRYNEIRKLGSGACGLVRLVSDTSTGQQFAMKIVKKRVSATARSIDPVLKEVEIMRILSHPCVVRLHDVHDRPEAIYMLLEVVAGGDLCKRIQIKDYLSEEIAKLYFYQICHAVKYIHDCGIIHRDLKLENVLLATNDEETLLKVCDFGLSTFMQINLPDEPPVVAQLVCTPKADIWSLGVLLFCCLSGTWPFSSNEGLTLGDSILSGKFAFNAPQWKNVSQAAKLLITEIFNVDPKKRPSIDYILQCTWLKDAPMQQKAKKLMKL